MAQSRARAHKARVRGMELVNSVDYKVSLRWVFYALLQEGIFRHKDDYKYWVKISSRARKRYWDGWRPDTLSDDTRWRIARADGYKTYKAAVSDLPRYLSQYVDLAIDHFFQQGYYVELWFEAKAMSCQFQHYTAGIDLVPFGGDASIPFKHAIAVHLDECAEKYNKPVRILYFGDCDPKGLQIPDSAVTDIRAWCDTDFEVIPCGLTLDQATRYNLPENPEKPGQFQWEALNDDHASEIIRSAMSSCLDTRLIELLRLKGARDNKRWKNKVFNALADIV